MNTIWRMLKMPWLARVPSAQGWVNIFVCAVWVFILANHAPAHPTWVLICTAVAALAVAILWFVVPNALWLARDARELRLPRIEREADLCLPAYALISILLPALVLGAVFGHTWVVLTLLALTASAVMTLVLLPAVWTLPMVALGVVVYFFHVAAVPLPGSPGFLVWAVPAAIVLGLASLQRWVAIRHAQELEFSRWLSPSSQGVRMTRMNKLRGGLTSPDALARHSSPKQLKASGHLRDVGPEHPVRSIRMGLDGQLKPLRVADTGGRKLPQAAILLVLLLVWLAIVAENHLSAAAIAQFTPILLMMAGILGAGMGTIYVRRVDARWAGAHAELPLLALLPHLASPLRIRQKTLLACIAPAWPWLLGVFALAVLIGAALHAPAAFYLFVLLMVTSGALLGVAETLRVLGGRRLGRLSYFVPKFITLALVVPTMFVTQMVWPMQHSAPPGGLDWLLPGCIALWIVWLLVLAAWARRGWRALQCRPHPFLANAP